MAITYRYGGDPNNTNAHIDTAGSFAYMDGYGMPGSNVGLDGKYRMKIYAVRNDYQSRGYACINYTGTLFGGGEAPFQYAPGSAFRQMAVNNTGGEMYFGRNTGGLGTIGNSYDSQTWQGDLCGEFDYAGQPGVPSSISTSRSGDDVTVSWGAASDGGASLAGYTVQYQIGTGAWQGSANTAAGTRTYTFNNFAEGSSVKFRVYARNEVGSGAARTSGAVSIPSKPSAPSTVNVARSGRDVTVSWSTPSNGGASITRYEVAQSADGGTTWAGDIDDNASPYTYTNLALGGTYRYRVRAVNEMGAGPWKLSATISIPTTPGVPPSATATRTVRDVSLAWTAPSNGGASITGYEVSHTTDNGSSWSQPVADSASPRAYPALTSGATYRWRVRALNEMGAGGWRESGNVAIPAAPDAPASVTMAKTGRSVTVTIAEPPSNGGEPISGYQLQYSSDAGATWSTAVAVAAALRTYTYSSLPSGTYLFRAYAANAVGSGATRTSASLLVSAGGRVDPGDGVWRDGITRVDPGDGVWRDAIVKVDPGDGVWRDAI